ncbi:hypothetical protein MAR_023415 [Mya arenaria]|uniref:Uncharacterized protein n=1 Tax=Mya arenaria TaxID=6604 RepID=A0ABY7DMX1_MYAAR|nr:hypothetical protein MAR_023415 [Mya arenaria]
MDQPLFAIAKTIQWNFTATNGEDKYLIMAGGLHIEMPAFKVNGDWLDGSDWTTAIFNAGIATSGVADSLLKATHVTRKIHAHQITAAALCIMQHDAYDKCKETLLAGENLLNFTNWGENMTAEQPQFKYWSVVLEEIRNPFRVDSCDMFTLDTKLIMDSEVHTIAEKAHTVGQEKYELFVKERFEVNQRHNKETQTAGVYQTSTEAKVPGCKNEGRLLPVFQIIYCMLIQGRKPGILFQTRKSAMASSTIERRGIEIWKFTGRLTCRT